MTNEQIRFKRPDLPCLGTEELYVLTSILHPSRSRILSIADIHQCGLDGQISTSPCIEVGGMPHLGKSKMLSMFERDTRMRGLRVSLINESPTIPKSYDEFTNVLHNLSFLFGTVTKMNSSGTTKDTTILDRGLLTQIPFIQTLAGLGYIPEAQAETSIKFIVSTFSSLVDSVLICNADPNSNLKPLNSFIFNTKFSESLSNNYKILPETIRVVRNSLRQNFTPLTVISIKFDGDLNRFRHLFFRSLGSLINDKIYV